MSLVCSQQQCRCRYVIVRALCGRFGFAVEEGEEVDELNCFRCGEGSSFITLLVI
eukprot:m.84299 g.84299  ORF g.84299 m.84299 type:complete len:55 (+) comp12153_c1_seq2:1287-1451(+)